MNKEDAIKNSYINNKIILLKQFHVPIDESSVRYKISQLYPNEVEVENYTHRLIRDYLYTLKEGI